MQGVLIDLVEVIRVSLLSPAVGVPQLFNPLVTESQARRNLDILDVDVLVVVLILASMTADVPFLSSSRSTIIRKSVSAGERGC